jgi:transketolase
MITRDQLCVNTLRMLSVDMIEKANSGHPGLPLGAAPMAYVLWSRHLRFSPKNPEWFGRDRFVLSAGHGSSLNYALLHLFGYDLSMEELKNFRQLGSSTAGHPEYGVVPGVEATTGPLGQGLGMSVGLAVAEEAIAANTGCPRRFTYALVSDGDLMEGVAVEAASFAGHQQLGNLILLYDDNDISLDGPTTKAYTEDPRAKFEAMGWHTIRVEDGNDLDAIDAAITAAKAEPGKPTLIQVKTHIGYGSPKQDSSAAHGAPLGADALAATKEFYGWPTEPFHFAEELSEVGAEASTAGMIYEAEWSNALSELSDSNNEAIEAISQGNLPEGWDEAIKNIDFGDGAVATRDAGKKSLNAIAGSIPWMVGGSADLACSTKTIVDGSDDFRADDRTGRNVWFGVREHAMGAICNGMALGGLKTFGSTFLVFSDYMRGSIRLGSLMGVPSTWVFTHDSVCVGEDGPTHQPVEHVMSLRLIPGLKVYRPGDAYETAECWRLAVERNEPSAIVLTRQGVPIMGDQKAAIRAGVQQGGYVLRRTEKPAAVLLATGSEVSLALAAADKLAEEGIEVQVSSIPCWEIFEEQTDEVKADVLCSGVKKVSVEAGVTTGWAGLTGRCGQNIGIDTFGESGPGGAVYKHVGFTVENVVAAVKETTGSC